MNLVFRKVDEENENDVVQFNNLMDDLSEHAENQNLLKEKIHNINQREDEYLLVAEDMDRGIICGSAFGIIFDDLCGNLEPVMVIENVVTHHEYRRIGVGRAVLKELEEWGKLQKAHYAILCSALKRKEAHSFYGNLGYEEVKGFKKYL